MQSYSSQRNTTIADFQQIQVSTTLSKSSKWKVIEKAFPAPQLWTSTPKNHPTRYCIYTGGLIHQETPDTSSFQWAEAPQRFCTPSQRGCRSRLTICQLNQFITNSEAAMLSTVMALLHCTFIDLTPSVKLYLDNSICSQLDGARDEFWLDLMCVNFLLKGFQFLVVFCSHSPIQFFANVSFFLYCKNVFTDYGTVMS